MYPVDTKINEKRNRGRGLKLISDDILIDTGQELPIYEATYPTFEGFKFGDPAAWTKGQPFDLYKKNA